MVDKTLKGSDNKTGGRIENPLHKFASYNCLFTLSGLNEAEIRNPRLYLDNDPHDVVAKSAGIGTKSTETSRPFFSSSKTTGDASVAEAEALLNKIVIDSGAKAKAEFASQYLTRNHDIFFEELDFTSVHTPNEERSLANFTKVEFELHEPYGTTLLERLKATAFNNGYIDHLDAPFLLTIEWKGYDTNGNPTQGDQYGETLKRKIPVSISRVEFDVNQGGTVYRVVAVAYSEMAMYNRYLYTRTGFQPTSNDMTEFCRELEGKLNSSQKEEVKLGKREFPETYSIGISDDFKTDQGKFAVDKIATVNLPTVLGLAVALPGYLPQNEYKLDWKGFAAEASPNTAITKILEDAMKSLPYFRDLIENFWETYFGKVITERTIDEIAESGESEEDIGKRILDNQYVPWFKIRTTIHTDTSRLDSVTGMHPKTVIYRIEPYSIHVLKLVRKGINFGNLDWASQVKKDYNYIFTGDNLDIQNLRIFYKAAFFQDLLVDTINVQNTDVKKKGNIFTRIFGGDDEPTKPKNIQYMRQYPSITRTEKTNYGSAENVDQFFDYLTKPTADMTRVEMEILGDPCYLSQDPYITYGQDEVDSRSSEYVPLSNGDPARSTWSNKFGSFNFDQAMPIINLRYLFPTDINENAGIYERQAFNPVFNGVYEVSRVHSKMSRGQFTQTLIMTRLNNQEGEETRPKLKNYDTNVGKIVDQ
jgi:hypothetical protein